MNLDLFKDLIKSTKENDIVQSFIKELGDCLKNNLNNNERNQIPLVQKILDGRILTTRYRDEINIQRHDIINNYSKEHSEQGEFYYVYNKRSNNTYDEYAPNGIFNLLDKKVNDGYTWIKIASIDGNDFWVAKLSYVTELPVIVIPKPVERNENVKQCEVLHNKVILRKSAGGDDYDPYAPVGIHNVLAEKEANGYVWYMIGKDKDEHEFWVASGGARTKDLPIVQEQPKDPDPVEPVPDPVEPEQPKPSPEEPDPAPSYNPSELNTLIAMIDELKERISNLVIEDATHASKIAELEADNKAKEALIKGLEESEKNLSDKVDGLNNKLADGVKELKEAIEVLGK